MNSGQIQVTAPKLKDKMQWIIKGMILLRLVQQTEDSLMRDISKKSKGVCAFVEAGSQRNHSVFGSHGGEELGLI